MDEEQTNNTTSVDCSDNTTLPLTVDLAKLSIDSNSLPVESTTRVLRKRVVRCLPNSTASTDSILNRRCSLKPKKRRVSEMDIEEEKSINDYYLDKKINKKINLETIYEETDNASDDIDSETRMSTRRFKRMLMFSSSLSKIKKRRAKIKKIFESKQNKWYTRKNNITKLDILQDLSNTSKMNEEQINNTYV
ncbi:uncharacterized protein [Anoplolepis gracilipes]|uniref:uncharacterized protein n=1 Tax=Anoplolepis gracilipes TaxID=354296 RepID=UPI003BA18E22